MYHIKQLIDIFDNMRVFQQTIGSLVDENYIYARALAHLGISFFEHPDRKLGEICKEMGLDKGLVMRTFYFFDRAQRLSFKELNNYPLEIVLEYLRHSHHMFIKEKLPFIANLINTYDQHFDLKLIFPEFIEEFINHIYEEEDTVFTYIHQLLHVNKQPHLNPATALWKYRKMSMQDLFDNHSEEDELAGVRNLLDEINDQSIHWQVILKEIKAFDREMWYHASIENKILFPRALEVEKVIFQRMEQISKLN